MTQARAMLDRRGIRVLVVATVLMLAAAFVLRDTPGYFVPGYGEAGMGEILSYVWWTRLVTLGGVQDAYSGTWPETYAVYGPVVMYSYQLAGNVYRLLVDPSFDLARAEHSLWLNQAMKVVALVWHFLTAAAIYFFVRRMVDTWRASLATGLYLANPVAILDIAHWAQPDGAHTLFSVLAVGWLTIGQPLLGWGALAVAALAKPQAWALLPLLALATWREGRLRGLLAGGAVATVVSLVVVLPYIVTGHLGELLTLPQVIASVNPYVTANAHNFWWLVFGVRMASPFETVDTAPLLGPLSYRTVAAVLVLAQLAVSYWLYHTRRAGLAEATALAALGWFVFTTQAHENHAFFVLPLLALAWPGRRSLLRIFALLSVTVSLNMALQDPLFLEPLGLMGQDTASRVIRAALRTANAGALVLGYVLWVAAALRRSSGGESAPAVAHATEGQSLPGRNREPTPVSTSEPSRV